MEENKKTNSSKQTEHKTTTKITLPLVKKPAVASKPAAASKPTVVRKPTVRKPLLKTNTVPAAITAELELVKIEKGSEENANDLISLDNEDTVKLDKNNLKKLKKIGDKVKEKETKAKLKAKTKKVKEKKEEKTKKAKKKEKAKKAKKKEKAKLKEKKAKKKASAKKNKSKKK
jgi:hypothetical protein